jgi:hypothetical protein
MAAGAAGRGPMRASHADREEAIEALKDAFVHGRLTKDELDARAGRALAARTCAELAALTDDIQPAPPAPAALTDDIQPAPPAPAASGPTRPLVLADRRPLARAAARSGGCLALAVAAVWATFILDPGPTGADRPWAGLILLLAQYAVIAGVCTLWSGVTTSVQQRRSGRQLPPAGRGRVATPYTTAPPPRISGLACPACQQDDSHAVVQLTDGRARIRDG